LIYSSQLDKFHCLPNWQTILLRYFNIELTLQCRAYREIMSYTCRFHFKYN